MIALNQKGIRVNILYLPQDMKYFREKKILIFENYENRKFDKAETC